MTSVGRSRIVAPSGTSPGPSTSTNRFTSPIEMRIRSRVASDDFASSAASSAAYATRPQVLKEVAERRAVKLVRVERVPGTRLFRPPGVRLQPERVLDDWRAGTAQTSPVLRSLYT